MKLTGKQWIMMAVLAGICQITTSGLLGDRIESAMAYAVHENIKADDMNKGHQVRGSLSIAHETTAFLRQASGTFDKGSHGITVEIIAEYNYDQEKNKLVINHKSVLGHLVIDNVSGQHFLKFSKFLVSADSRTILYRSQSIASPDVQVIGKLRLNTPISFETESNFISNLAPNAGIKLGIVESNDSKTTTKLIGKSTVAEVSTEIFPAPSEIKGKSFTIRVAANNEEFIVHATDPDAISLLVDNFEGKNEFFVTGRLAIGDGGFNTPWSWHLDPASTTMAEFSIELCDGVPSDVENNLAYWLFQVEIFCPWSSKVVAVNE